MAKALPWKVSFNGGELSPRMAARTDQQKYAAGSYLLQNFIPTVQGPAIRRGGTYWTNEVSNSANRTWLVPFTHQVTGSYQIEFGDQYLRFFTNRGVVTEAALVITGATQANPCVLNVVNSFSAGDEFYIAGVLGMTQLNNRFFRVASATGTTITLNDTDGNPINSTAFSAYTSGGTVARIYQIASPYKVADLTDAGGDFRLKYEQSQDVMYVVHPSYPPQLISYFGNTNWTIAPAAIINGPFNDSNSNQNKAVYLTYEQPTVSGAVASTAATQSITGFSAGASQPNTTFTLRLLVASSAAFGTGMQCAIAGVTGSASSLVNGTWPISVVDGTHIDVTGLALTAAQIATLTGGTLTYAAGKIRLTVSSTTGITNGNAVMVVQVAGTTEANGVWPVYVVDGTHLDLIGSTFTNAYTSGGLVYGSTGTVVTITANAPIFQNVGADGRFYIEYPLNISLPQWYPGKTVAAGDSYISGFNTYLALNAGTTGNIQPEHTQGTLFDGLSGIKWLYVDSGYGSIKLTSITNNSVAVGVIEVQPPIALNSQSAPSFIWALGLYDSVQGYPEMVRFFRDRLNFYKGIQLAGSKTSDYLNFAPKVGGIITADAGYVQNLPTSNAGRWMSAQNDLLIGTAAEEILVSEIDNTKAFGPGNIKTRRQTPHGSRFVDSVPIEFVTMFVTKSGQQLRQMIFSVYINGYVAEDMTTLSEHIPKGPDGKQGITQMAWQAEPDLVLWCSTTDGRLVGFTYNRDQQVMCWHNHPLGGSCVNAPLAAKGYTNAVVECVSTIPSPDGTQDDLWLIVRRTINGVTRRYVEYLMPYFTDIQANLPDAFYVDAGITYSGASTSLIQGVRHLIGQKVDVLAGGGAHPQVTVAADGSVQLQYPVTKAQIGLPCPARFQNMRIDAGSQLGTAQGTIKRIASVVLRFLNSIGGKFGNPNAPTGESSYDELFSRSATDHMDTPVPMQTGDQERDYPYGYETDGIIGTLFDVPLPVTLVGLRADVDTNETVN